MAILPDSIPLTKPGEAVMHRATVSGDSARQKVLPYPNKEPEGIKGEKGRKKRLKDAKKKEGKTRKDKSETISSFISSRDILSPTPSQSSPIEEVVDKNVEDAEKATEGVEVHEGDIVLGPGMSMKKK